MRWIHLLPLLLLPVIVESAAIARLLRRALARAEIADKEACYLLGIDRSYFCQMLQGHNLSAGRILQFCQQLPESFRRHFMYLLGAECGLWSEQELDRQMDALMSQQLQPAKASLRSNARHVAAR